MPDTTTTPQQQLVELEARVCAGDMKITPDALAKARAAVDLADLQDEAARRLADDAKAAERRALEDAFRAEVEALQAQLGSAQAVFDGAVVALRALGEEVAGWQRARAVLVQRGRSLGLSGEVEGALVDLARRDWVAVAQAESRGEFERAPVRVIPGGVSDPGAVRFHALHSATARAQIARDEETRNAARADRVRVREEHRRLQRESDRVYRAGLPMAADDRTSA